jgi:hypothetical protein
MICFLLPPITQRWLIVKLSVLILPKNRKKTRHTILTTDNGQILVRCGIVLKRTKVYRMKTISVYILNTLIMDKVLQAANFLKCWKKEVET